MRAPLRSSPIGFGWRCALALGLTLPVLLPLTLWRDWRAGADYRRRVRLTRSTLR